MNDVLEAIRVLACSMNLVVLYQEAIPERSHILSLYYGKTCLHRTSDLSTAEFYLYGFRDGRTTPSPEAHEAADGLLKLTNLVKSMKQEAESAIQQTYKLDKFIDPQTRERS